MSGQALSDIFITHAWRFHDEWTSLSNLLDAEKTIQWRNFSVPWYDPALEPHTPVGARNIRIWLEGQIRPVIGVIFLDSVYAVPSARKWLEMEVDLARQHRKPIIGLPKRGADAVSAETLALVDEVVGWDAIQIIATLQRLSSALPEIA